MASDKPGVKCEVLAVGPGEILDGGEREAMPVSEGDIVYCPALIEDDGKVSGLLTGDMGGGVFLADISFLEVVYPS